MCVWSCSKILFYAMCSVFGRSISIVTCFYNYLIAAHSYIVLSCYILVYAFLSAYIFKLGGMLINIKAMKKVNTQKKVLTRGESNREVQRVNTQTRKSTPARFQKGKHNHIHQGVLRKTRAEREGRPPRPPCKQR